PPLRAVLAEGASPGGGGPRQVRRARGDDPAARRGRMNHGGRRAATVAVLAVVGSVLAPAVTDAGPLRRSCPATIDPSAFASAATLQAGNQVMADAGPRPTASPAHEGFVDWVE